MKKTLLSLVLSLVIVSACQALSEQALSTTEPQIPAPTSTSIPISALDFSSIVITQGDLPAGYTAAEIHANVGDLPGGVPSPDAFYSQSLSYNNQNGGHVTILLYEDVSKVSPTYDSIVDQMPAGAKLVDVGEIGAAASSSSGIPTVMLTFVRCQAVISIQWIGASTSDDILSYAVKLDKRVSPFVCRSESHE